MKSSTSIRNISIAAIKRHAIDMDTWLNTTISLDKFALAHPLLEDELPIVTIFFDNQNWTLITTDRIVGKIDDTLRELDYLNLDDIVWGDFKSKSSAKTIFRTTSIHGDDLDFLMECGKPSIACIYGITIIDQMYKANT